MKVGWSLGWLFLTALLLRLGIAWLSPGTDDVQDFISVGRLTREGHIAYQRPEGWPYPLVPAWILAGTVTLTEAVALPTTFGVRLPSIIADSAIALLIVLIARHTVPGVALRLGWLYALNPITILIASHHGQFDAIVYLPVVLALWMFVGRQRPWEAAFLLGVGGAIKVVPVFIAPAWFPDLRKLRYLAFFVFLVLLPFGAAMWLSYVAAPQEFVARVLEYRQVAVGGWGYNFLTLLMEHVSRLLHLGLVLDIAQGIRLSHRYILIAGVLLTAYLVRERAFMERAFLIQIAVQLFAGIWGPQYSAWLVPLVVLSNQQGMLPWGGLTVLWMLLGYGGFISTGVVRDTLFRATTIVNFCAWVALALWYSSNLVRPRGRRLKWLIRPLIE